ncbi:unnamed protein product [Arabidopsis arenosa]|uniref:Protein kinase domain-containing protein n=1 Tax=Arabidopsis arenosa TaxID=38785 RepID=A0A8S2A1A5_ARAAE|nr:unnamed protein product [Arabidopsis arenosa]
MEQRSLLCFLYLLLLSNFTLRVAANVEGDALTQLRNSLSSGDPANNVLQSWDATLVTPCTWFHVTCNPENKVTRVDLGNAKLSGKLVPELGQLSNLQYLELYSNNITGEIPEELGNLMELVSLDLYANSISGPIPSSLGKLGKLRFLRLNNNSLSGEIPMTLTAVQLQVLDISNNRLTGDIPVNGSFSLFTPISFMNNNLTALPEPPPTSTSPTSPPPSGSQMTAAIAGGVAAGAALLFAVPAIAFAWWLRRKPQDHFFDVPAEEDPEVHLGQLKRFTLRELLVATDNFSNKNVLGRGGFGKVYKGRLADGNLVAVKRLKEERTKGGELQFQTEVEMISMAVHRNLLRLRGFCMTPTERLLVYPYMANGSVASCLRERPEGNPPLDWPKRKHIALGSARGLAYLHDHCDQKIIHRDLITGQKAFDLARLANDDDIMLLDWVKEVLKEKKLESLVDAELEGKYVEAEVEQLIQMALLCTQSSAMERPKMSEVVRMLEGDGLAERWEEWQKEEMPIHDFNYQAYPHAGTDWLIPYSNSLIENDYPSGPR